MLFQILLVKNDSCRFPKKLFKHLSEYHYEWGSTAADMQRVKDAFDQGEIVQFGDNEHEVDYFILFKDPSKSIDTNPGYFTDLSTDYYVGHLTFIINKSPMLCSEIKLILFKDFEPKEEVSNFLKVSPELMAYHIIESGNFKNDGMDIIRGIFKGLGFKQIEIDSKCGEFYHWSPWGKINIVHTLPADTRIRNKVEASGEGIVIPANTEGYIYEIVEDEYETYRVSLEGGMGALFKLNLTDIEKIEV